MENKMGLGAGKSTYFPHIDGLRCVAVMSVVLFHFGLPGVDGGYTGVDVFFVISGYLITRVIADEVAGAGRFDFGSFYARRIRRILPALLATLAVTTLVAMASLTPADLVSFGRSLVASSLSLSNFLFWSESGYFEAASKTKPLLHTWSLSVEEQFYLFWPAFLFLAYRAGGRRGVAWGIVVAGLLSFAANHWTAITANVGYRSDLFFLPHFRVFEFAIGASGWFLIDRLPKSRRLHEVMAASGLLLIGFSVVFFREGIVFPYTNALVPCLGALMVIAATNSRVVGAVLTNPVSVWIGKVSYSLYLVHWPVVVFVEQYIAVQPWGLRFVVMALLSLISATALHHLVEVRFRYAGVGLETGPRRVIAGVMSFSALVSLIGLFVAISNGMTWRYQYFTPGALAGISAPSVSENATDNSASLSSLVFTPLSSTEIEEGKALRFTDLMSSCAITRLDDDAYCAMDRPLQILVFGNSHEPDAFNAFHRIYGEDPRVNLISFGTVNDCQIDIEGDQIHSPTSALDCEHRFSVLNSETFLQKIDVVIYNTHQGFDPVAAQLWELLDLLKQRKTSLQIIAIGSYLQTTTDCSTLYNRYRTFDACGSDEFVNYFNPDERTKTTVPQVSSLDYLYVSKYLLFCEGSDLSSCETSFDGVPAFYDQHHLSREFSWYMGERIMEVYGDKLIDIGFPAPQSRGP